MAPKRILYIEDNFQNRRLVKKLLKLNGYEMLEAEDALQGIALAARERPEHEPEEPGGGGQLALQKHPAQERPKQPLDELRLRHQAAHDVERDDAKEDHAADRRLVAEQARPRVGEQTPALQDLRLVHQFGGRMAKRGPRHSYFRS